MKYNSKFIMNRTFNTKFVYVIIRNFPIHKEMLDKNMNAREFLHLV